MKLYNTLTRQTEDFVPLNNRHVKIYSCGLTVYSQPHVGNWTGYIYWDVLVRTLQRLGYTVERTQNYTDVGHLTSDDDGGEDKMEKSARIEGLTAWDVAEKYIAIAEEEAYQLLDLIRPTHVIRATEVIQHQIKFAQMLEENGFTYIIPDEGLYFDTSKLSDYGKLARLDIDGLNAGARVSVEGKRAITDFAIWKFSPAGSKRDMEWDSPWGKGFPGWHLECSVIARQSLGDQIDIHTGGIDHIPVHHTNEIAQTESVTKKQFARYWLHNNHIKVNGTKISKSLGNIITLQNIRAKGYNIDAFKLMVLSKHYRTEGNFSWDILSASQNRLLNWERASDRQFQSIRPTESNTCLTKQDFEVYTSKIAEALESDLNTPKALSTVDSVISEIESFEVMPDALRSFMVSIDHFFGFHLSQRQDVNKDQKELIDQRETARINKDWEESDRLRDKLLAQGIGIHDTMNGPIWFRQ